MSNICPCLALWKHLRGAQAVKVQFLTDSIILSCREAWSNGQHFPAHL